MNVGDRRALERLPGGGYAYVMVDDGVRIEARYIRRDGHQLHAEVDVQCNWAGVARHGDSVSCADLNLSSQTTRKTLAKHCAERAKTKPEDFDWLGAIDAACLEIIRAEREGGQTIVLDDAPAVVDREIEVYGLRIPTDSTSMLIAHGDSMKSLILLLVLASQARQGKHVLYCDWEWSADRHRARKRRLFGDERLETLHYRRCYSPLVHEADGIRRDIDKFGIEAIGVDSVGLACDGKLIDDDTAVRFHRALASFNGMKLCAAHVPKSSIGPDAKDAVGPFGSVFFSNLCRVTWLVKKQPGPNDDTATVMLSPTKQNDGSRLQPVGMEFLFDAGDHGRIRVRNVDVATIDGFADKLPLATRIKAALRSGPLTYAQLAENLDAKVDSVIKTISRHSAFTKVPGADGVQRIALVERRIA